MGCGCFTITQSRSRSNGYRKAFKEYDVVPVSNSVASSEKDLLEIERVEQKFRSSTKVQPSVKELVNDKKVRRLPPVKETHILIHNEDFEGNKMINEYVRECKIGSGSYCKVVLHRGNKDGNLYAVKIFRKSRLGKIRASHSGNAMSKVLTEVSILKQVDHPNIVKLIEVIDDPDSDRFYMVLEYMERGWIFKGSGPSGGIGEGIARKYFQDIVAGLKHLHSNNIVHGDIKPENLLVSSDGSVKICDFSESCKFEDNNDELKRSAGTPVFTAPECSQGFLYHGKVADIWALGITLYCMVLGQFPFIGETLRETFHKIVNHPMVVPDNFNTDLADLLNGLLCKDPMRRISLDEAMRHPWVVKGYGHLISRLTDQS
ncbi:serine/threonine-protein kinase GRIK2 isoform X2 [Cryptomeria japonica]|uniref:serine/threonine-protein kinase GRIK2 isoform X2 n=1 Tax=Cryptomeria japonica TaxID=3369 RepID=UPI0025AC72D8|nr:serine/threonine-protein kinase GRIK2 isoform X2 [Cryptomeria japonica]